MTGAGVGADAGGAAGVGASASGGAAGMGPDVGALGSGRVGGFASTLLSRRTNPGREGTGGGACFVCDGGIMI